MKIKDNNIDSLFRDRLDGLEIEPSAGAQEMMDRLISGKHQRIISIRVAIAAVIVLAVISGILLPGYLKNVQKDPLIGSVALNNNDPVILPEENSIKIPEMPAAHSLNLRSNYFDEAKNMARLNRDKPVKDTAVNPANMEKATAIARGEVKILGNKFLAVNQNDNLKNTIPSIKGIELARPVTKQTPVVIEYFADNQPKEGKEKSQLVEGIVSKAKEIGREVNYGEIRDLKDQLFALDFIKSKREDNNSK